ncbi:MAG: hypothetical protein PHG32_09180, partial [Candidatus Cloacimonetes bacterium]|nr:hypothetical protein [Candidatus Cloacimonadota bacterium]
MDKRTFIALFVVVILFFVWSTYFGPKPQPATTAQTADSLAADTTKTPAAIQTPAALPDSLLMGADSLKTLTLANANFTVRFGNRGASITSIELKKFSWSDKTTPVDLVPEDKDLAGIALLQHKAAAPRDLKTVTWHSAQSDTAGIVFWLGEES